MSVDMTQSKAERILGITVPYTLSDLKQIHRRHMVANHPDRFHGDGSDGRMTAEEAERIFVSGKHAYDFLESLFDGRAEGYAVSPASVESDTSRANSAGGCAADKGPQCHTDPNQASHDTGRDAHRHKTRSSAVSGSRGHDQSAEVSWGAIWTWFVITAVLLAFVSWNRSDPQAAFEFAVGLVLNPMKLMLFVLVAVGPGFRRN